MFQCRVSRRSILGSVFVLALACGEDVADPGSSISITPTVQWVGGEVRISGLSEPDASAAAVVRLDGRPVDTRAVDANTVAFTVPNPGLSRTAEIEVEVDGTPVGAASLEVVGVAIATWRVDGTPRLASYDGPLALTYHGAASNGLFVAPLNDASGNYIGILDLRAPTDPPLRLDLLAGDEFPGLVAPGPATAQGALLVDISPPDVARQPIVLQVTPSIGVVSELDCVGDGILGGYAIAELGSGDCLVLDHPEAGATGTLSVNGASPVPGYDAIPREWSAGCVRFVGAPGGTWVTLRNGGDSFDPCQQEGAPPPPDWPVFGADGGLAFTTGRYPAWPVGVGFSDGALWAVGETASGWSLDTWNPTDGSLETGVPLDGFRRCGDLATDPAESRIYLACWLEGVEYPRGVWPALVVFDVEGLAVEAVVETVIDGQALSPRPPYQLVVDGAAGRVHFVTVWDGTSAPVERGVMGVSYDVLGVE